MRCTPLAVNALQEPQSILQTMIFLHGNVHVWIISPSKLSCRLSPHTILQVLKLILQTWYWDNRPSIVRRLMRLVLSRNLLDMIHPSGETYEAVYYREWLENFEEYFTLKDHTVGACHACVCLTHYLSERKMELLRDSGVPILCQVRVWPSVLSGYVLDIATVCSFAQHAATG